MGKVGRFIYCNGAIYDSDDPIQLTYNIKISNFRGYKTVNYSPEINSVYTPVSGIQDFGLYLRPTLTPFGKYGVGIVYYDEYLRPSFVQPIGEQVYLT